MAETTMPSGICVSGEAGSERPGELAQAKENK